MDTRQARLVVEGRGNWVYTHQIGDAERLSIGRSSECDLHLNDMHASGKHCEIVRRGEDYFLCDLGSRNGVLVDDKKVDGEVKLKNGAGIKLGITTISFITGKDDSFASSVSIAMVPGAKLPGFEPEAALQPMIDRLDGLRDKMKLPSAKSGEMLHEVVEDLQKELREARAEIRRLRVGHEFSQTLAAAETPHDLIEFAMKSIAGQLEAQNGFIMTVDSATKKWVVRARTGDICDWSREAEGDEAKQLPMSLTIVEQAIRSAKPVGSQSAIDDSRYDSAKSVAILGIQSFICHPILRDGKACGVVYVDRRTSAVPFSMSEEKIFEILIAELSGRLFPGSGAASA